MCMEYMKSSRDSYEVIIIILVYVYRTHEETQEVIIIILIYVYRTHEEFKRLI